MMASDLSPAQRSAVEWAARVTWRPANRALCEDDRRQIAALAVLEMRVDAARSDVERDAFMGQRARGAVLDALRLERRDGQLQGRSGGGLQRSYTLEDDDEWAVLQHALEQPERREELRRVAAAVDALPHPLPTVALRLAEGYTLKEIAQEMGVSESRICQRRRELCEFMWEMTTCLD